MAPWLAILVMALVVANAYAPSLGDGPRADHLAWLADVAGEHGLWELTVGQFAYTRTRHFNPGDTLLFRPALYAVLGLETYFFGYNFTLWQAAGLVFHLAVSLAIGWLLYRIHRAPFAWMVAVFFASLYAGMELVIWEHLHGYLLFCLTLVLSVVGFEATYGRARPPIWAPPLMAVSLVLGAFAYELGVLWCGVVGLYLLYKAARLRLAALTGVMRNRLVLGLLSSLGSVAAYMLLSFGDLAARNMAPKGAVGPGGVTPLDVPGFGMQALFAELWWLGAGLLPFRVGYMVTDRLIADPKSVAETARAPLQFDFSFLLDLNLDSFLARGPIAPLVLFLALPLFRGRAERIAQRSRRFDVPMLLLVVVMQLYALLIAAGRFGERGVMSTIANNTYYAYVFWVIATPVLYWRIAPRLASFPSAMPRLAAWVAMATWVLLNAQLVQKVNFRMVEQSAAARSIIGRVDAFAKSRTDPSQRIWVEPGYAGNRVLGWLGDDRDRHKCIYLVDALFPDVVAHPIRATHYLESSPKMESWAANARARASDGTLAWWSFEDPNPTGKNGVVDASPAKRDGTISGGGHCQQRLLEGRSGTAMFFDGGEMSMDFPDSGLPQAAQPRSVAMWVAPDKDDTSGVLFAWGAPQPRDAFYLEMSKGRLAIGNWGTPSQPVGPGLARQRWHHVALTYDGRSAVVWLDGQQQYVEARAWATTLPGRGTLGSMVRGPAWPGRLDEVKIFDHALSPQEIAADLRGEPLASRGGA